MLPQVYDQLRKLAAVKLAAERPWHTLNPLTLRRHQRQLVIWFQVDSEISAEIAEGFNSKAKLTLRKWCGFGTDEEIETALFHTLGQLPEPKLARDFC